MKVKEDLPPRKTTNEDLEKMRAILSRAREEARRVISRMKLPTEATNAVQRSLEARSGTPRAFADGLVETIGEISLQEATQAIRRYEDEWNASSLEPVNGTLK